MRCKHKKRHNKRKETHKDPVNDQWQISDMTNAQNRN